eukprot:Lankesteria_metandrocarpae@DN6380_c0_g1_i1.p1
MYICKRSVVSNTTRQIMWSSIIVLCLPVCCCRSNSGYTATVDRDGRTSYAPSFSYPGWYDNIRTVSVKVTEAPPAPPKLKIHALYNDGHGKWSLLVPKEKQCNYAGKYGLDGEPIKDRMHPIALRYLEGLGREKGGEYVLHFAVELDSFQDVLLRAITNPNCRDMEVSDDTMQRRMIKFLEHSDPPNYHEATRYARVIRKRSL